jgi:D-inositol-3-phosphate glycosyltransferase
VKQLQFERAPSLIVPMRIAMVSAHASPLAKFGSANASGLNSHVAGLASALGRRGHRVTVFTRRDCGELPDAVQMADNVMVEHLDAGPAEPMLKDDLFGLMEEFSDRLFDRLALNPPDIVHAHFWMSAMASFPVARALGSTSLVTFHGLGAVKHRHQGSSDTSPSERVDVESRILQEADQILATCAEEVVELACLGASWGRITIVPCGYDETVFTPYGARLPLPPLGQRRVSAVARLVPRKGLSDVMEAVSRIPDVELVIAGGPRWNCLGDDPGFRSLRELADSLGVRGRVRFMGGVSPAKVAALHRSSVVSVAAPWYEPFGIAPVEAMACGRPVIATAVGGQLDTVVDGLTGFHVPSRDPNALESELRRLLNDRPLRRQLGVQAAIQARSNFTWTEVAGAVEAAYASCVSSSERSVA